MPLGITLTLLLGSTTPRPAPSSLVEAVETIEVTHQEDGRSGFQIVFHAGRSLESDLQDDAVLTSPLLAPFTRVIVTVALDGQPQILLDGIITYLEFSPSLEPGNSILTITGEDVSVMMDLEEKSIEHPALDDRSIVNSLISSYAQYGLQPKLSMPSVVDRPTQTERTPVQLGTDLEYIRSLAARYGFVFYIIPGALVGKNIAYWGPPQQKTTQLKAISFNLGSFTNVETLNFQYDALSPTQITGQVQDRKTNQIQPLSKLTSQRSPLSEKPAITHQSRVREVKFRETARLTTQAQTYAQSSVDRSIDQVLTATGQLDTLVYGALLERGCLVPVRGIGYTYDGLYGVRQVTHTIQEGGTYKQQFTIAREGLGTAISSVTV